MSREIGRSDRWGNAGLDVGFDREGVAVPDETTTHRRRAELGGVVVLMTVVALIAIGPPAVGADEEAAGSQHAICDSGYQVGKGSAKENTDVNENSDLSGVDINLEGSGPGERFPRLKIHFTCAGREEETVSIRFPEGIAAVDAASGKHLSFYSDTRSPDWPSTLECEPVNLPVDWQGDGKQLSYTMCLDNGMILESSARVEGSRVILTHALNNATSLDLRYIKIVTCVQLQLTPSFADLLMERTAVPVDGTFRLFREIAPEFKQYPRADAVRQRFLAFRHKSGRWFPEAHRTMPHPGHPDDPNQAITFWQAAPLIDSADIATVSSNGDWRIATGSDEADTVWTNPGISCQHADATVASCRAGEAARVTATVSFLRGGFGE